VRSHVGGLKLGLEFFNACGPDGVGHSWIWGLPVFLDLQISRHSKHCGGRLPRRGGAGRIHLNVHPRAGRPMMRAAVGGEKRVAFDRVIAVTMLTSLSDEDLPSVGLTPPGGRSGVRLAGQVQPNAGKRAGSRA